MATLPCLGTSDLGLLGHLQGVVHVDPQVAVLSRLL